MISPQPTPWVRATARRLICCASTTRRRARRLVSFPSNSRWASKWRSPQPTQTNRRRRQRSVTHRPGTDRSRILFSRRSCTRRHQNPQCAHRTRHADDSTTTSRRVASAYPPTPPTHATHTDATAPTYHPNSSRPSWLGDLSITDSSRASTPSQGPSATPHPTKSRRADSIRMRTRDAEKCDGGCASHEIRFLHTRLGCPPIERSPAIREREVGIARPPRDRCFAHRTLASQRQIVRNCGAPTLYISERRAPNPTNESVVQNSNLVP